MIAAGPAMHRGSVHDAESFSHPPGFAVWEAEDISESVPFGPASARRRVFVRFVHTRIMYLPTGRTLMVGAQMFVPSNPDAPPPTE